MRYKNIELRQHGIPDSNGHTIEENQPNEIISWTYDKVSNKEWYVTICWLKPGKDSYYMETIGDRYVEHEDMEALNHITKYAIRILNTNLEFKINKQKEL